MIPPVMSPIVWTREQRDEVMLAIDQRLAELCDRLQALDGLESPEDMDLRLRTVLSLARSISALQAIEAATLGAPMTKAAPSVCTCPIGAGHLLAVHTRRPAP